MKTSILVLLLAFGLPTLSQAAPACRVTLKDSLNKFETQLTSQAVPGGYTINNNPSDGQSDSVTVKLFGPQDPIVTDAGTPSPTRSDLNASMSSTKVTATAEGTIFKPDSQLTYQVEKGATCTLEEISLIHFLVMEWFYFG